MSTIASLFSAQMSGQMAGLPAAIRVMFVGQLGKYVPGAVWALAAQVELARDYDVPRRRSTTASLVGMAVSQLPTYKARHTVILGKHEIASATCDKGMINNKIRIVAADGTTYVFNRQIASADPIMTAIAQGR